MANFTMEFEYFLYSLLLLMNCSFLMAAFYRLMAYITSSIENAQTLTISILVFFLLFSGVFISYSNIPIYFQFFYWISPFSWTIRGIVLNEYNFGCMNVFVYYNQIF